MSEKQFNENIVKKRRIIALVAEGLKDKEIADVMGTTHYIIKNNLRAIYDKLGLWNRVELALWYESRRNPSPVLPQ